jgi:tape measure domain-containing protein
MFKGNEKAAKNFIFQIEKMSAATPYTTSQLGKNAQVMMSFGMSSEKTMKVLKQLGDVAGGNQEKMRSLSLAFAQVSSAGKLSGQDLLQMINAGFNPLQIISKKTGRSIGELKEIMAKGGISAKAVAKAFEVATAKGGLFYKGAERGSLTLAGLFSTLKDAGEKALRMLGETLKESLDLSNVIPRITKRIIEITRAVSNWIKENPALTKTIIKILLVLAAIGPVLFVIGKGIVVFATMAQAVYLVINAISFMATAFKALISVFIANPILLAIMAIAVAVFLIIKYWKPISKFFKKLFGGTSKVIIKVWKGIVKFLKKLWEGIKKVAKTVWNGIVAFFKTVGRIAYKVLVYPYVIAWEYLKKFYNWLSTNIILAFKTVIKYLRPLGKVLYAILIKPYVDAWNVIKKIYEKIILGIEKIKKLVGTKSKIKVEGGFMAKTPPALGEKSQSEIMINVKSMPGTEAIIERMKMKGKMKVKAKTSNYTGRSF